jgi:hypothetical protein
MRLADRLGVDRDTRAQTCYACLLSHLGCTSDAHDTPQVFGDSLVRTEEVPVRFELPDIDEYLSVIADTAGPPGLALRGLSETERAAVKTDVEDSLAGHATACGFEIPGVALCAVAD